MKKILIGPFFTSNPYTGFLPVILLLALSPFLALSTSLIAASVLWGGILITTLLRRKTLLAHPALISSAIVLLLVLLLLLVSNNGIGGIMLSTALTSILILAATFSYWFFAKKHSPNAYQGTASQRLMMLEYSQSLKSIMLIGLLILTLYITLEQILRVQVSTRTQTVLMLLPAAMGTLLYTYELIRLIWVKRELSKEEWISLADSQGEKIGQMPRSMQVHSRELDLMLPVVRIIAYSQEMIYLAHNKCCDLCESDCYDTPFFSFIAPNMQADEQAQSLIDERFCGVKRVSPRNLLSYSQTYEGQERLVHLYLAQLDSPDQILCDNHPLKGKWWPIRQIEEQLASEIFSPFLQSELPYMQQTVLLAEQIKQNQRRSKK